MESYHRVVTQKSAQIFVVDDHPIFRLGIRRLLEAEQDLLIAGEAETSAEAMSKLESSAVDLVIVDVSLKGSGGIDLVKQLRVIHPQLPLLVISMHDEHLFAERALRAGAAGYVTKDSDPEAIVTAVRKVLRGELAVSEKLAMMMLRANLHGSRESTSMLDSLSDREMEVFELIGRGVKTRAIADSLSISVKTVESHQSNIKRKLGISGMTELRRIAAVWSTGSSERHGRF